MNHARILLVSMLCCAALLARAGPRDSVTVTRPPDDQGASFVPGTRLVVDLPRSEYVEEEFFVEGKSTLFNYAHNPPTGPTDITAIQSGVPYKTRLIVRRPADPDDFDGTVVVEWWNSTAGFDTAPVWDPSAEYFARHGVVYVGVTNSIQALGFLAGGCRVFGVLPPRCGTRYQSLSLAENGLAYEMMNQISNLLLHGGAQSPLPASYQVARLLHAGESQQAGSVISYASAFHFDDLADGYFIQAGINARSINSGPRCGEDGVAAYPGCTPRLQPPANRVSTDLRVPVYQLITQTDFEELGMGVTGRQADTPFYRYFEVAGGGHNTVHKNIELIPAGLLGDKAIYLDDLCANPLNTTADGPVFVSHVMSALWHRMIRQVANGNQVPAGRVMDQVDGVLKRDQYGNVTGGVRVPAMEAPTARYDSTNVAAPGLSPVLTGIGNLACRLSGSVIPFDGATLDSLYPDKATYVARVRASVDALMEQGLLLRSDAAALLHAAEESTIGE